MSTSPYPGLRPFNRDEADIFFGRDEQVDQLLIRLGKSRFLAVVGPSGCGKSSLVHTGLLNALEAGFLADVGLHWRIATMQPGSHPMRNLAAALVKHIGPNPDILNTNTDCGFYPPLPSGEGRGEGIQKSTNTNPSIESDITSFSDSGTSTANEKPQHDDTAFLLATLRRGPLGLIEALQEQPLPENTNLLLVVDQFEEIFRYREHQDRDEADAFVALLLRSFQDSKIPVYIVITMRSDFLGDCALFPGLPEALNDSQFLTPRLNREQRRLAITGPARVCGGDVEPALVNRLLNDMGADPDQLPVLQHALMRLWTDAAKRDEKPIILKLNDYETLGGWDNTLSNHADEAFAELDEKQQTIAEIMFRALTERSGNRRDTRRPVSLQAVAGIAGVDIEQVIPVIEVFRRADRSFLIPPIGQPLTEDTLIDIGHESLIRQWQRMKEWVEQEAQSADTYRRLEQTALLHDQKRAGLLQGLDLFPVLAWKKREPGAAWASRYGEDFDRAMRFLTASDRRQTLKSILKFLGMGVICIIAAYMTWLWQQADTERHKAASARLLAEGQLLRNQDSLNQLSVLLGIEAWKHYPHSHFALNQFLRDSLGLLPAPYHTLQHNGRVFKVVFMQDGKQLATASGDKTARLWDAVTGKELLQLSHDGVVTAVTFSSDGKQLATASYDKTARLWDAATGNELQRLSHDDYVYAVIFSPDGKQIATASDDKTARLWDAATGKELQRLTHDGAVRDVTFSPDGKQIATASDDKTARLWDPATGKELQRLTHDGAVIDVTFSSDGKQLATASYDKTARLWDAATGNELQRLSHDDYVYAVIFSPDGKQFATASWDMTARLWDAATGKELQRLSHDSYVFAVTFSPDGKQLATASYDNTAQLWDAATGKELQRLNHDGFVTAVTFSPDGKHLATAGEDRTARLWDFATPSKELLQLSHDGVVTAVTFSSDGKQLATASGDKTARLWDAATGKELQHLSHESYVTAVRLSPDGKQLATASRDNIVRLWDAVTGKELQRLSHDDPVIALTFSLDSKQLNTLSRDKTRRYWSADTGKELHWRSADVDIELLFDVLYQHPGFAYSPDKKQYAFLFGNTVLRRENATDKELQGLNHVGIVTAVTFSPDGKQLATASEDKTARLWDAATGKELQRLTHDGAVRDVTFSPDGKQLATASGDKTARLWLWQPEDLIDELCSRLLHNLTWDEWQNYFEGEPYRKTCAHLPVYPGFREKGRQLVNNGNSDEAVKMLEELNAVDPALQLNPNWIALKNLAVAERLLQARKIAEALAAFNEVELMDAELVSAKLWNNLCRQGALINSAPQVLFACDKAVNAAENNVLSEYRDSRGLARALAGNSQGAIEDFEFFIEKTAYEQLKKQRQAWVQALRAGQNPFTKEELATLQDQ